MTTPPSTGELPPSTSRPTTTSADDTSGLSQDLLDRYNALKKSTVTDMKTFMTKPSASTVFDFSKIKVPRHVDPIIPGVVLSEHAILAFEALKQWGIAQGLTDSDADLAALVTGTVQNMTSFSTSTRATPKPTNYTSLVGASKTGLKLTQADVNQIIGGTLSTYGYENPLRQFGRSISSAIISLTAGGYVQPNYKMCIQRGLPPQYYAYGADCILVDARHHGFDASLAAELAKMVAINRNSNANTNVHNLYEYTSASPQIFTNGRQAGGR